MATSDLIRGPLTAMMSRQSLKMGLLVSGLVVLATLLGVFAAAKRQQELNPAIPGLLWPEPKPLGPFSVIDHENNPFTLADLHGKWSLFFFGFTHCPDICPVTLAVMDKARGRLEPAGDVQFIFVTVDPDRDTSGRMAQYLASFNPEFIGLGGSEEQVAGLTGQIGLPYFIDKTENEENYLVDHGASLFLVDPLGRLVGIFSAPHNALDVSDRFQRIREFIDG